MVSQNELILQRRGWKRNAKQVVCVTGIFDLLHPGHIRLLEQARGLGDIVVVAVESDARALERKGSGRPVTPAGERAEIAAALQAVDFAVELPDGPPAEKFMAEFAPEVLVHGGSGLAGAGAAINSDPADVSHTKVVQIPPEPGHSTSRLIERIKQLRA